MSAQPDLDQASHSFDPVQARVVLLFDPLVQLFDLLLIEKGLERVLFVVCRLDSAISMRADSSWALLGSLIIAISRSNEPRRERWNRRGPGSAAHVP